MYIRCRSQHLLYCLYFFFFKQKTAYEMRISDWSSDVCSSDLAAATDRDPRIGAEALLGISDGFRILVHQQQASLGPQTFQHTHRVTTAAKRAIQIFAITEHPQGIHHRPEQPRQMGLWCVLRSQQLVAPTCPARVHHNAKEPRREKKS